VVVHYHKKPLGLVAIITDVIIPMGCMQDYVRLLKPYNDVKHSERDWSSDKERTDLTRGSRLIVSGCMSLTVRLYSSHARVMEVVSDDS
jgi:hypothetical protein